MSDTTELRPPTAAVAVTGIAAVVVSVTIVVLLTILWAFVVLLKGLQWLVENITFIEGIVLLFLVGVVLVVVGFGVDTALDVVGGDGDE